MKSPSADLRSYCSLTTYSQEHLLATGKSHPERNNRPTCLRKITIIQWYDGDNKKHDIEAVQTDNIGYNIRLM